jgi:Skp family chaperone for outer membrane proteins
MLEFNNVRSMRSWIIAFAVVIATAAGGSAIPAGAALAQASGKDIPIVVGTLDVPTLLTQSKAGKSLAATLQQKGKAINADISKKEQGLRTKRQQLEQQRSALQPADYEAQLALLEKEFNALRKEATTKRKDIEKAQNAGLEQIRKALDGVIREVADKRGLTLIINRSAVVLGADDWDITNEVKKALDAKLPAVKL